MKLWPRPEDRLAWPSRWGIPSLVLILAFGLRLFRLGDANLWWDEALAVWAVRKGLLGVTLWTAGDVHPPLFFWFLWAWVQLVGESEFAMRLLSAAFGVLTVAVVYSLGSMLAGRVTGSLASLLTGLARFHVWWSQELRMYVLAGLLGALSLHCFLRWLRLNRSGCDAPARMRYSMLVLYVLSSLGALYTIFLMAAVILAENITVLSALLRPRGYRTRSLLLEWVIAQFAILGGLGGWLIFSWGRMSTWSVSEPMGLPLFVRLYATLLTTGISTHIERYTWGVLPPFAILGLGALVWGQRLRRRREIADSPREALTLVLVTTVSAAAIYLSTLPRSLFYTPRVEARYFLPFAPAFWLLLAWSIVLIVRRWKAAGWAAAAMIAGLWCVYLPGHYTGRYLRDELQSMVRAIISQAEPGDVVLLDSGGRYPVFLYYYGRISDAAHRPPMIEISPNDGILTEQRTEELLAPIAERYKRFWLAEVEVNLTDPQHWTEKWLSERYPRVLGLRYGHNALYLYDPQNRPPSLASDYVPQHGIDLPAGTRGQLKGWELPVSRYTSEDTAHIALLWEQVPEETVQVSLRNERGQVWLERRAETDNPQASRRQQFDLPLALMPNGTYDIVLFPAPAQKAVLGRLHVEGAPRGLDIGPADVQLDAHLGDEIALTGYALRSVSRRSLQRIATPDKIVVDLYWRAERKPRQDYTVFVHLLGETLNPRTQGPVWAQHDSQPANDGYPTTQWFEGQEVIDRHLVAIDEGVPPGRYTIEVGMYTQSDGKRLPVRLGDGRLQGDRVLLETPVVVIK